MLWNDARYTGGINIPDIMGFDHGEPYLHRIVPDVVPVPEVSAKASAKPAGKVAEHEQAASGLKIRCDKQAGILEILDPRMLIPGKEPFCRALGNVAITIGGATSIDLDLSAHLCRFHFEPGMCDESELARRAALAIEAATLAVQLEASSNQNRGTGRRSFQAPEAAIGQDYLPQTADSEHLLCMALGSSSLAVALAGIILPGIPSAPFLLFSAHYFLRSSTAFQRWLDGMPRLAEVIRKLEASGQMTLDRSTLLKNLGIAILLGLMFLVIHPPLPLVMGIELGLTVFLGLREIGELEFLSDGISKLFA